MEDYYETYIYSVVGEKDSPIFGKFTDIFADKDYKFQLDVLNRYIDELGYRKRYQSIIDLDIYFFGLIYFVVFEKKTLDLTRKDVFIDKLEKAIRIVKNDYYHTKSPACLKYLHERISKSITIYRTYFS